jgi:hypothetical protein
VLTSLHAALGARDERVCRVALHAAPGIGVTVPNLLPIRDERVALHAAPGIGVTVPNLLPIRDERVCRVALHAAPGIRALMAP